MILKAQKRDSCMTFDGLSEVEFHSATAIPPRYVYDKQGGVFYIIVDADNGAEHLVPVGSDEDDRPARFVLDAPGEERRAICGLDAMHRGKRTFFFFEHGYLMNDDGKTIERLY